MIDLKISIAYGILLFISSAIIVETDTVRPTLAIPDSVSQYKRMKLKEEYLLRELDKIERELKNIKHVPTTKRGVKNNS